MKAIFDTRPDTHYKDVITYRYHFPARYLSVATGTIGDWIIFRHTRRGSGKPEYVSIARVEDIVKDQDDPTHFYAMLGSYTQFYQPVPLRKFDSSYWETSLRRIPREKVGTTIRGKSIRPVSDPDFTEIVYIGLAQLLEASTIARLELKDALSELVDPFKEPELQDSLTRNRVVKTFLSSRTLRDANFRGLVLNAYENKCAVSGLCIINGQGKIETNAAHIRPVADDGPDIVGNGLALSATCHWVFDRHLISLTDDGELLLSNSLPNRLKRIFPSEGEKILLPTNDILRPNPAFLAHHREKFEQKWGNV